MKRSPLRKALDRYLATAGEDDADDLIGLAETAFTAGWYAARPIIKATSDGHLTHNADPRPGHLKLTLQATADDGREIQIRLSEEAVIHLKQSMNTAGIGLDWQP